MAIPIESLVVSMGTPNPSQLSKIQKQRPEGTEPYVAEELFTATFAVFDNLVRGDWIASHQPNMLEAFSKTLPGKPLGFEHYKGGGGRFYDSVVTNNPSPGRAMLAEYGFGAENRAVVKAHGGHLQVWGSPFMPADSELARQIRFAQHSEVSIGPFSREWTDRCPDCTCGSSAGIFGSECPNIHPAYASWVLRWARDEKEEKELRKRIPPYVNREA